MLTKAAKIEPNITVETTRETERENMHKNKSDRKVCNRTTVSNTIKRDKKSMEYYGGDYFYCGSL